MKKKGMDQLARVSWIVAFVANPFYALCAWGGTCLHLNPFYPPLVGAVVSVVLSGLGAWVAPDFTTEKIQNWALGFGLMNFLHLVAAGVWWFKASILPNYYACLAVTSAVACCAAGARLFPEAQPFGRTSLSLSIGMVAGVLVAIHATEGALDGSPGSFSFPILPITESEELAYRVFQTSIAPFHPPKLELESDDYGSIKEALDMPIAWQKDIVVMGRELTVARALTEWRREGKTPTSRVVFVVPGGKEATVPQEQIRRVFFKTISPPPPDPADSLKRHGFGGKEVVLFFTKIGAVGYAEGVRSITENLRLREGQKLRVIFSIGPSRGEMSEKVLKALRPEGEGPTSLAIPTLSLRTSAPEMVSQKAVEARTKSKIDGNLLKERIAWLNQSHQLLVTSIPFALLQEPAISQSEQAWINELNWGRRKYLDAVFQALASSDKYSSPPSNITMEVFHLISSFACPDSGTYFERVKPDHQTGGLVPTTFCKKVQGTLINATRGLDVITATTSQGKTECSKFALARWVSNQTANGEVSVGVILDITRGISSAEKVDFARIVDVLCRMGVQHLRFIVDQVEGRLNTEEAYTAILNLAFALYEQKGLSTLKTAGGVVNVSGKPGNPTATAIGRLNQNTKLRYNRTAWPDLQCVMEEDIPGIINGGLDEYMVDGWPQSIASITLPPRPNPLFVGATGEDAGEASRDYAQRCKM